MRQTVHSRAIAHDQDKARLRRAALVLAVSAGLALGATACGSATANPTASASASGTAGHITAGGAGSGAGGAGSGAGGAGSGAGGAGSGAGTGGSGQRSAGSFSLPFARCMRAHGVPNFPDPNGRTGQLGPGSGIDPNSPQFQSALNGPCKSIAPLGWLNSGTGPITR